MSRGIRKLVLSLTSILATLVIALSLGPPVNSGVGMPAPEIAAQPWLNAQPQRLEDLRGKVVLVKFWTFGCYNCQNVEPYVKEWHRKYAEQGLAVIAVHSPEFNYERNIENVKQYIREHSLPYAVAIDNDFVTWKRYRNWAWPTLYLIDKRGVIRYVRIGEGGYTQTDQKIRNLLAEDPN